MATKIYIGRLSHETTQEDLEDVFKTYGQLNKIDLKLGFAFIEFQDSRDAEDAIRDLNGREIRGSAISVQAARGAKETRNRIPKTDYRVLVEGLNHMTSWQDLKDFAREAGKPIFTDVFSRQGERVGLIEYETFADMENALRKLDDADLKGNRVRVVEERRALNQRGRSFDRRSFDRERGGGGRRDRDYNGRHHEDEYRGGGGGWNGGNAGGGDRYRRDDRRSRSRDRGGDRGGYRDEGRRSRDRDYRR